MSDTPVFEEVEAEIIEPEKELQVNYAPAVISDNLTALDSYVESKIAPYVGVQIDPEDENSIKTGRAVIAELNKLKAPIEEERKRIKRAYEEPFKAFEGRVKGITSKIDKARADIKTQVDEADEKFRQNRRDNLKTEYEGCAGAMADVVPFDAILDEKWLNRSTALTKATNQLYERTEMALKGYNTLQSKQFNHKDEVIKSFAHTLDIISALDLEDKLNAHDREMAEFKAAQEAAQTVKEERTGPTSEQIPEPFTGPAVIVGDKQSDESYQWSLSMEFEGSRELAERVVSALKALGITGASIKCMGGVNIG